MSHARRIDFLSCLRLSRIFVTASDVMACGCFTFSLVVLRAATFSFWLRAMVDTCHMLVVSTTSRASTCANGRWSRNPPNFDLASGCIRTSSYRHLIFFSTFRYPARAHASLVVRGVGPVHQRDNSRRRLARPKNSCDRVVALCLHSLTRLSFELAMCRLVVPT